MAVEGGGDGRHGRASVAHAGLYHLEGEEPLDEQGLRPGFDRRRGVVVAIGARSGQAEEQGASIDAVGVVAQRAHPHGGEITTPIEHFYMAQ